MEKEKVVNPNGVCAAFDRISWSLIEEPEVCELCRYYEENGSRCTRPEDS